MGPVGFDPTQRNNQGNSSGSIRHRQWDDPHAARLFVVGTSDSVSLTTWLDSHRWPHRSLGAALFEVRISSDSLESLSSLPGIDRIESPPRRSRHSLDPSRTLIQADPVHKGVGIGHSHHGTKALVGIIDVGFDLNHLAFQDSAGDSRIIRVWDQSNTTGKPPAGFSTGTLFTNPTAIQKLGHTGSAAMHGTHVAGLAAGRAWPSAGGEWWGVADDARIAVVDCGEGCARLNDGLKYLFRLADSLELPVVVNMSWGTLNGPRNGNSTDCVLTKSLVGPGKVAVVSAGNSGGKAAHASHSFHNDTVRFALQVAEGTQTLASGSIRNAFYNEVETWGDSGRTYQAWVEFLNDKDSVLAVSSKLSVGSSKSTWVNIDDRKILGTDTMWHSGNIEKRSGQSGLRLSVSTSRANTQLRLAVTAAAGSVHGWIWEDGLEFLALDPSRCKDCVVPDSSNMISDKATCPAVISVGANNGYNGFTVWWSSKGPGLGSVPKPDIGAPGVELISALNSAGPSSTVSGTAGAYSWGPMSGTSMSAPLVSGTVALILESNPKWNSDSILRVIKGQHPVFSPDTGWASLNVLRIFQTLDPAPTTAIRSPENRSPITLRAWITPTGRRITIPDGSDARDFHPGGIAWFQACQNSGCTTRGMLKP